MIRVVLRALSFLRPGLAANGIDGAGTRIELDEGTNVGQLIARCGLADDEVEAVFVNHKSVPREWTLHDGDGVVLVPPGTPGPHRYLLGMAKPPQ